MDTTEQYIKMRIAAIPDLGMGKPPSLPLSNDGVAWIDYTVFIDRHGDFYYSKVNLEPLGRELKACQLERQDQLQEMLLHHWSGWKEWSYGLGTDRLIYGFEAFTDDLSDIEILSMEQLWLAFVQKEINNKTWDGNKWVT